MFFYRDPEEADKEEQAGKEVVPHKAEVTHDITETWVGETGGQENWSEEVAAADGAAVTPAVAPTTDDWVTQVDQWSATAPATSWVAPDVKW